MEELMPIFLELDRDNSGVAPVPFPYRTAALCQPTLCRPIPCANHPPCGLLSSRDVVMSCRASVFACIIRHFHLGRTNSYSKEAIGWVWAVSSEHYALSTEQGLSSYKQASSEWLWVRSSKRALIRSEPL